MKRWLILDVHYLCHRAFHTTHGLTHNEKATGVVLQFLKSIASLKDELRSDRIAFCFEHPHLFRRDVYPTYKQKRKTVERTDEEKVAYQGLVLQISELQKRYLPKIGFKNIFASQGMESDDVMAEIAATYGKDDEVVLVTADHDLYQCLAPNVMIYNPQKQMLLTEEWFVNKYGIRPGQWAVVKAIAGCLSDEVEGIRGVGEITALKYVRQELKHDSKVYKSIVSQEGRRIVRRNKQLVKLPYEGCPTPLLVDDKIDRKGWAEVCRLLGMKSIINNLPIATRRLRQ